MFSHKETIPDMLCLIIFAAFFLQNKAFSKSESKIERLAVVKMYDRSVFLLKAQ